jgi:DNA gyrase subunit A
VPVREFREDQYLLFATRKGVVKRTALSAYSNIRTVGLNAINIREGDELIEVKVTTGDSQILLGTRNGMAIRFKEQDARPIGRATSGVRGISLSKKDVVVGMVVVDRDDATLLVVTEGGMGKRTAVDAYRLQQRGGKGVINIKTSTKTGKVVAIKSVSDEDELMFITRGGVVNRQRVEEIRTIGRATQGVRLVNLDEKDIVMDVARVIAEDGAEEEDGVEDLPEEEGVVEDLPEEEGVVAGEPEEPEEV